MKKIYYSIIALLTAPFLMVQGQSLLTAEQFKNSDLIPQASSKDNPILPGLAGTSSTFSDYYENATKLMLPKFAAMPQGAPDFNMTGTLGTVGILAVNYDNSASVIIDEVLVLYASKSPEGGGVDTYNAYIYDMDTSQNPLVPALDSASFTFSDVNAPLSGWNSYYNFTSISFASNPVTVTGNFFVGINIDYQQTGARDRVYVYTNNCNGDGNALDRMRVYPVPGCTELYNQTVLIAQKWYTLRGIFLAQKLPSYNIPVLDCDPMIIPIVQGETHTLSTNAVKGKVNNLTFNGHYPNPAKESITINYTIDKPSTVVNLRIFDITGKTVYETNSLDVTTGKHSFDVDIAGFSAGNLYYTLSTDDGKVSSRFTVVH